MNNINDRLYSKDFFMDFDDLEDTHNRNDEFLEYCDKNRNLIQKYVDKEELSQVVQFRDLRKKFNNGEDVSFELNKLYVERDEPAIKNLDKELIELMEEIGIKPNIDLNNAKKAVFEM